MSPSWIDTWGRPGSPRLGRPQVPCPCGRHRGSPSGRNLAGRLTAACLSGDLTRGDFDTGGILPTLTPQHSAVGSTFRTSFITLGSSLYRSNSAQLSLTLRDGQQSDRKPIQRRKRQEYLEKERVLA